MRGPAKANDDKVKSVLKSELEIVRMRIESAQDVADWDTIRRQLSAATYRAKLMMEQKR